MACGAKYMELVRTASGYTPDDLWHEKVFGLLDIPSSSDFEEWEALAVRLRDEAFRRIYELGAIEQSRESKLPGGTAIYPRYTAMRDIYEPLNEKVTALQDAFSLGSLFASDTVPSSFSSKLGEAATLSIDLACLIEQIDTEIATYGVAPRSLPGTATDKDKDLGLVGKILFVGAAVGIVGGTVLIARAVTKGRSVST